MRDAAIGAGHLRQAVNEVSLAKRGDAGELRIGLKVSGDFAAPEFVCSFHCTDNWAVNNFMRMTDGGSCSDSHGRSQLASRSNARAEISTRWARLPGCR